MAGANICKDIIIYWGGAWILLENQMLNYKPYANHFNGNYKKFNEYCNNNYII